MERNLVWLDRSIIGKEGRISENTIEYFKHKRERDHIILINTEKK